MSGSRRSLTGRTFAFASGRGAGLTKACGTGACAALVCAARAKLTDRRANLILDGGTLIIDWQESDDRVYMTGPVQLEFETEI